METDGKGYYADFGSIEKLAKALTKVFVYDGIVLAVSQTHAWAAGEWIYRRISFVGFIQNHDQVGNRAIGDRLEHMVGMDRAKVAAGLVLTAPFIPLIFQGEEFAASSPFLYFADHEDPEMAKAVSEGRRARVRGVWMESGG